MYKRQDEANAIDPIEKEFLFCEHYETANIEQRNLIDRVIREVLHHDTGSNVFCLTAHADCGKTFTQTAIIHKLNSLNLSCIATAVSYTHLDVYKRQIRERERVYVCRFGSFMTFFAVFYIYR